MRGPAAVSVVLVLAVLPSVAADDDVRVTTTWEPTALRVSDGHPVALQALGSEAALPSGVRNGRVALLRLGGRSFRLLVESVEDAPRLWYDRNLNQRLDDDPAVRLETGFRTKIALEVKHADEPDDAITVHVGVWLQREDDVATLLVRPDAHRRGQAVLGGRLRRFALWDGNADLSFDDPTHDLLFVDLDGDGRLDTASAFEQVRVGEVFPAGGVGYTATVAGGSGRVVTFRPTADAPAPRRRPWPSTRTPEAGITLRPSNNGFELLAKRFREQKSLRLAKRKLAVYQLGSEGSNQAFDLLMKAAKTDRDKNMRPVAFAALGNRAFLDYGGDRVVAFTKRAPPALQREAPRVLYRMGHPGRARACIELLSAKDPEVVGNAARHLAYEDTQVARAAIFNTVRTHPVEPARAAAYEFGARSLEGGPTAELMRFVFEEEDDRVQLLALRDLHATGEPEATKLALSLTKRRPVERDVAETVIPILGRDASRKSVAALLEMADAYARPETLRTLLEAELRWARSPRITDAIIDALDADSPHIRMMAADLLARGDDRRATSALVARVAKEHDDAVKRVLLRALGDQRDPASIDTLVEFARRRNGPMRSIALSALARIGFDNERVRGFFVGLLDAPQWPDRLLAIAAAGESGDPSLCASMLPCLGHSQWQVRLALLRALRKLRCRDAIEPLIERLANEESGRVRHALAVTLYVITGVHLYDDVETWRRWWRENAATFRVPKEPPAKIPAASDTNPEFYGIPLVSNRIAFVIDQSGSMSATSGTAAASRLDIAKSEVLRSIAQLDRKAKINVVLFNNGVRAWRDGLVFLSPSRRANLEKWLARRSPNGGTNLYDGLERALLLKEVDTVYLLSDGEPGVGRFIEASDILREVRRLNLTRGIAIHCVSIGRASPLLRELAAAFDGHYVRR